MKRRLFLLFGMLGLTGLSGLAFFKRSQKGSSPMIRQKFPLDFQWQTQEPFLFCVHHLDLYPKGNAEFGPDKSLLAGRNMGEDFKPLHGFRMYHGETVPGFPVHPHRGFETVTVVRRGYIDHADSMGAAGRYGGGDVQWMTAGKGVQHSEMFPLLKADADNTVELFQIWLNLPKTNKMVEPDFKMFWHEQIPVVDLKDKKARITLIAGSLAGTTPPAPPKASWASAADSETAIWIIRLEAGGSLEIPAPRAELSRSLYSYGAMEIEVAGEKIPGKTGMFLDGRSAVALHNTSGEPAELLLLQSRPIGEPVMQYGPFVMNTRAEIEQTIRDYQRTEFGGWPWDRRDMVHGPKIERFAKYPDGRVERPQV
jgi:hypothetical protein